MDTSENNVNFEATNTAPKKKTSKRKSFFIGTVITVSLLVVFVIIMAIVVSNRYLEKTKDFYPVEDYSFNGYEIVNDDGLLYLTKDGKKVSREGYTQLFSLSAKRYVGYIDALTYAPDAKIYDYFLARKEDSKNYFLIDGEGEELMIEGESWEYTSAPLPFVSFNDEVTGEVGVLSLENLDSDISTLGEKSLTLNVFDDYTTHILDKKNVLAGAVILKDSDAGKDSPKYIFADATGKEMFTSVYDYKTARIYTDDSYKDLVLASNGYLYDLSGNKLNHDVTSIEEMGDCVIAHRSSNDGGSNVIELIVYSQSGSFSIKGDEYDLFSLGNKENLIWLRSKSSGYTVFALSTGEKLDCNVLPNSSSLEQFVVCRTGSGFNYVDVYTGKTVLTSSFSDMTAYYPNVLYSPSESKPGNVSYVLHFVGSGKAATSKQLYTNQSIERIFCNTDGDCAYVITTTDNNTGSSRQTVYAPFASNPETKSYDKITVIDAFAEGAPIALATSFDSNRFEFIDVANSQIIYSVVPANAEEMALTSVSYVTTAALFASYDEGVEFAVFKTVKKDTNGDGVGEVFYAFSRDAVMTGGKQARSIAPITVTQLGENVESVKASGGSYQSLLNASKYMIVKTSAASSDVYTITDSYKLEKLATLPYGSVEAVKFGSSLDDVYLRVSNEQNSEVALYTVGGEMILGFHANINVAYDGAYIMAERNGVWGAYKYDANKGRKKQILNFEFAALQYMGDGGFLAQHNYDEPYYLYDEKSLARPDPITGIVTTSVFSWDADAKAFVSSTNTYYNIAGKLYVHRGEGEEIIDTTIVGSRKQANESCISYSPLLVNFYDVDGKLINKKVIYPTDKSVLDFKKNYDGNWYFVTTASLQNLSTKATAESITDYVDREGGVINVYKENRK